MTQTIKSAKTIALLKEGDKWTIQEIYKEYRTGFLLFATRFPLNEDSILDIYQDAVIALWENAQKGKLDNLESSLKTYLFAIGKYMIYSKLRDNNKESSFEDVGDFLVDWEEYPDEINEDEIEEIKASFAKLGAKCQEILRLFYYQEWNLDEITKMMNYENKDVTKSQKSRCIKSLRELLKSNRNGA